MLKLSTKPLILDLKNLKNLKNLKMVCPPWVRLGVWGPLADIRSSILPETCRHMACQDRFEYPMGPQTCPDRPYVNTSHQIWWVLLIWWPKASADYLSHWEHPAHLRHSSNLRHLRHLRHLKTPKPSGAPSWPELRKHSRLPNQLRPSMPWSLERMRSKLWAI